MDGTAPVPTLAARVRRSRPSGSLGSAVLSATFGVEGVHGRREAERRVDALYERQGYDEAAFEFREPTADEMAFRRIGPGHRVLCRDGVATAWHYACDADGRFTVSARGVDFRYDDERHARRLTVLTQDAIDRQRDGAPDSIRYLHRGLDGVRRFVATEEIGTAYLAVGAEPARAGEFEPRTLAAGTEVFFMGDSVLVPLGDPPRAHSILFAPLGRGREDGRVAFPADRMLEVPCPADRAAEVGRSARDLLREFARGRGSLGERDL